MKVQILMRSMELKTETPLSISQKFCGFCVIFSQVDTQLAAFSPVNLPVEAGASPPGYCW